MMELASMLAHEPFSDRPESVSPVIAGFLRSYNDHVSPERRQDLFRYAASVVGTRADAETECLRARMCLRWARAAWDPPPVRVRILHKLFRCQDVDGVYAARAAVAAPDAEFTHRQTLAFLDELISVTPLEPSWEVVEASGWPRETALSTDIPNASDRLTPAGS